MSNEPDYEAGSYVGEDRVVGDGAPGEPRTLRREVRSYLLGLALAGGHE